MRPITVYDHAAFAEVSHRCEVSLLPNTAYLRIQRKRLSFVPAELAQKPTLLR